MALVDAVLINTAMAVAYFIRYELQWFRQVDPANVTPYAAYVPFAVALTLLCLSAFGLGGVYRPKRGVSWIDEMVPIVNGTAITIMLLVTITFFTQRLAFSRLIFLNTAMLVIVFLGVARLARRALEAQLRARGANLAHVVIAGAGEVGRAVMRQIVARPELGYRIVGFLDDDLARGGSDLGRLKALGPIANFEQVLQSERVDEVIIALPWIDPRVIVRLVHLCEGAGVPARVAPDLFQFSLNRLDVADLGGIPLLGIKEATLSSASRFVKRVIDVALSGLGLLLTAPLFLLLWIWIPINSPGPAIFRQVRVGERGRQFEILKFRSMHSGAEEQQVELQELNQASGPLFKIKDDPRLTGLGRWLRRLSLDELPQLINVLRGEMSLIGPRPGLPHEVAQYQPWQRVRLDVAPGITGLWQVSGRSDLSFEEMCLLDIYYIENWSLELDISILARTVPRVLKGEGAY